MPINKISYETIENIDYQSKLSKFFFGRTPPPLLTKIAFYYGVIGWAYFFLWHLSAFLSIKFIDGIEHPEQMKANFNKIGLEYGIENFQTTLANSFLLTLLSLGLVLIGLFLIYRQKTVGYYLYFAGWLITLLIFIIMLGIGFFWKEVTHLDKAIILTLLIPYFLFFYLLKLNKRQA